MQLKMQNTRAGMTDAGVLLSEKGCLLDEDFLLSYDVNALCEVPGCFGSLDVTFNEHAVDCVDVYNLVFGLDDFNVLDVVDYYMNPGG